MVVIDEPGEQIDALDIVALGQRPGEFDHIERLAASIGIATEFELLTANESVDADPQARCLRESKISTVAEPRLSRRIHAPWT
jgi:hypothetical protein